MAVITVDTWVEDDTQPGGIRIETHPDGLAYGLSVDVVTSELTSVNWAYFYNGTLVVDRLTNIMYHVINGALVQIAGGGAGTPGPPGADGTYFLAGSGAPPAFPTAIGGVTPRNNDLYLDTLTGDVYKVVAGAWSKQPGSLRGPQGPAGTITDGNKGDITVGSSGTNWQLNVDTVDNTVLTDMIPPTIKGRIGTVGDPQDLSTAQVTSMLDLFTSTLKGLVPLSGGGTVNFLRADGTWAAPPAGGGITDGDKGDITVSGGGTVWTIDNQAVTYAKLQNINADKIIGRSSVGAGIAQEIDCSPTSRTLLSQTSVANWRTQLDVPPRSLLINTTAPLAGGGSLQADRTLTVSDFTSSTRGTVPASGGGAINFLRADGTWAAPPAVASTAWTALPLGSGWANYGGTFQVAQYRKVGDVVEVRGLIGNGTGQTNPLAQLPAGFRPPADVMFIAPMANAGGTGGNVRLDVKTDGTITAAYWTVGPATAYVSLSGIQFSTV